MRELFKPGMTGGGPWSRFLNPLTPEPMLRDLARTQGIKGAREIRDLASHKQLRPVVKEVLSLLRSRSIHVAVVIRKRPAQDGTTYEIEDFDGYVADESWRPSSPRPREEAAATHRSRCSTPFGITAYVIFPCHRLLR